MNVQSFSITWGNRKSDFNVVSTLNSSDTILKLMHYCVLMKTEMDDLDIIYFLRDAQWCKLKHCYLFLMSKSICSQFYLILFLVEGEMWSPTRWPLGPGCLSMYLLILIPTHIEQVGITTSDVFFFGVKFCNLVRKKRGPLQQLQRLYFGKKWLTCSHIWRKSSCGW